MIMDASKDTAPGNTPPTSAQIKQGRADRHTASENRVHASPKNGQLAIAPDAYKKHYARLEFLKPLLGTLPDPMLDTPALKLAAVILCHSIKQ